MRSSPGDTALDVTLSEKVLKLGPSHATSVLIYYLILNDELNALPIAGQPCHELSISIVPCSVRAAWHVSRPICFTSHSPFHDDCLKEPLRMTPTSA